MGGSVFKGQLSLAERVALGRTGSQTRGRGGPGVMLPWGEARGFVLCAEALLWAGARPATGHSFWFPPTAAGKVKM